VLHIRWQKQRLIDIPGAKILAHCPRLNQTRSELNSDYPDRLLGGEYAVGLTLLTGADGIMGASPEEHPSSSGLCRRHGLTGTPFSKHTIRLRWVETGWIRPWRAISRRPWRPSTPATVQPL